VRKRSKEHVVKVYQWRRNMWYKKHTKKRAQQWKKILYAIARKNREK
jgi:hypothetical protein